MTGWPPGMMQDDCRKLSKWFATRLFDFRVACVTNNEIKKKIATRMPNITVRVLDYIESHPSAKTKTIGDSLNLTAKQVDNVLYRYRQAIKPVMVYAVKKAKRKV